MNIQVYLYSLFKLYLKYSPVKYLYLSSSLDNNGNISTIFYLNHTELDLQRILNSSIDVIFVRH